MKRVGLKQQFHGEPDSAEEGIAATVEADNDEVTLEVKKGTVGYRVPTDTPDDQVTQDRFLSGYIELDLTLEDGNVLRIEIAEGAQGVDARMTRPGVPQTG